jgi:hypothetical protein
MVTVLKGLVVLFTAGLGALFAVGSIVAVLFEVQGFGRGDSEPRTWYIVALAVGFVACVAAPVAVLRVLFPARTSATAGAAGALVAIAGVLSIVGITVSG